MRFFSLGFTFNILHDLLKKSLRQTLVTVLIFCKTDTCDCYKGDNTKSSVSVLWKHIIRKDWLFIDRIWTKYQKVYYSNLTYQWMYVNTLSSTETNLFISIHIYIYMVWDFTYINSFCFYHNASFFLVLLKSQFRWALFMLPTISLGSDFCPTRS